MGVDRQSTMSCLVYGMGAALLVLLGLIFLIILIAYPNEWTGILMDLIASFVIQTDIAFILFAGLLFFLAVLFPEILAYFLSERILLGVFLGSAVVALPLASVFLQRSLSLFDAGETILLVLIFTFIAEPIKRFLVGFVPYSYRYRQRIQSSTAVRSASPGPARQGFRPIPPVQEDLDESVQAGDLYLDLDAYRDQPIYQDLLAKARGDETLVERWIEYERQKAPQGDPEEWMQMAKWDWESDNR